MSPIQSPTLNLKHPLFRILGGAVLALILAAILGILFPFFRVMTIFWFLLLFIVLQIFDERFMGGARMAGTIVKNLLRAGAGMIAFFVLRFLMGQVFEKYPIVAYRRLAESHGLVGAFWGQSERTIATEMVLLILVLWVVLGCGLFGKRRWGAVFLGSVFGILILLWAVFPAATDASLARRVVADRQMADAISKKGLYHAVSDPIKSGAHSVWNALPDIDTPKGSGATDESKLWTVNRNVCDVAWNLGDENYRNIGVREIVHGIEGSDCFGRTVILPDAWHSFCFQPLPLNPPGDWKVAFQFLDEQGRVIHTTGFYGPDAKPKFPPYSRRVRFEGVGQVRLFPGDCTD